MKKAIDNLHTWSRALRALISAAALTVAIQAHAGPDDAFLKQAYAGADFELKAGQLAMQNASNDQVKLLAHKIVTDHQQSNA